MSHSTVNNRRQLSMFVPAEAATDIENLRKIVDPIQHRLIPAHITICREDELIDYAPIRQRLARIEFSPIQLSFGNPQNFAGHGLLLNCIEGETAFRSLREFLLGSEKIRNQKPHITLAHPRNPESAGNSLLAVSALPAVIPLTFPTIYLIEQNGDEPWRVLEKYDLPADR